MKKLMNNQEISTLITYHMHAVLEGNMLYTQIMQNFEIEDLNQVSKLHQNIMFHMSELEKLYDIRIEQQYNLIRENANI